MLTKSVPYRMNIPEHQTFLDVLRADDCEIDDGKLEFWTDEKAQKTIDEFLFKKRLTIEGSLCYNKYSLFRVHHCAREQKEMFIILMNIKFWRLY